MKARKTLRRLIQYFLQGLIILAPIAITIYAVTGLFNFIDNILPNLMVRLFPHLLGVDAQGQPVKFPGLGFILVILIVMLVGYISSSFVVSRLVELFDKILERTPGINLIYSTVKDFFEAFAGNKRKFDKAALVNVLATDTWEIGFITQQDVDHFGLHDFVAVYVPQSYALSGRLYFVPKERVRLLKNISATDAMKFAISGGVSEISEDHFHTTNNNNTATAPKHEEAKDVSV